MAWNEISSKRARRAKHYSNPEEPNKKLGVFTLSTLHYPSAGPDSDAYDSEIDCAPQRIDSPQLDGWRVVQNNWHYAIGKPGDKETDGWVGFGGRQGAHWLKSRLLRVGYLHWPTRAWQDIGGAPNYDRTNLSKSIKTEAVGPNESIINTAGIANWADLWQTPNEGSLSASWRIDGARLKEEITLNRAGREWITENRPPTTAPNETYFGFMYQLDVSDIPRWVKRGILQDINGDFDDDDGTAQVELRDALDRAVAFLPISHAYGAEDENGIREQVKLRRRFWKSPGGDYYLLVGAKVPDLAQMPDGNIVFDPSPDTFEIAASADDDSAYGVEAAWPPTCDGTFGTHTIMIRKTPAAANRYVYNGFVRWDTSSLSGNTPTGATLRIYVSSVADADGRDLTADWYTAWPISCDDYTATAGTDAISGEDLTNFTDDQDNDVTLDNVDGVSTSGYTGLRLHISGGEPSGDNKLSFSGYDDNSQDNARLIVAYTEPTGTTGTVAVSTQIATVAIAALLIFGATSAVSAQPAATAIQGVLAFAATGAVSTQPASIAASGTSLLAITGTGVVSTQPASVVASGTSILDITGIGAVTTQPVSVSAATALTFDAIVALRTQPANVAASGTALLAITGAGAVSMQPVSVAIDAELTLDAVGAVTTQPAAVVAAGSLIFIATSAASTQPAIAAASGMSLLAITGTGAVTTQPAEGAATGTLRFTGTLAVSMQPAIVTVTGTSILDVTGAVVVTSQVPEVLGAGLLIFSGQGAVITQPIVVVAVGRRRVDGYHTFPPFSSIRDRTVFRWPNENY